MAVTCPECDSAIDIEEYDVEIGDELSCSECGALLRVSNDFPLELESVDEDEDLDDEDEEDEEYDEDDWEDEDDDADED